MSKGGAKVAQQNAGIGQSYSQGYQGDASGISGTELPFLQNELTNPQGFDPTDLSKMRTSSSQSIAGAEGAGKEEALLNASRTGNTAAVPGVIDQSTRDAMATESNNALGIDEKNALLKQQQQQSASSGLESMYGTDVSAALQALGLSNQAIGEWTGARNPSANFGEEYLLTGEKAAGSAASGGGG